MLRTWSVTVVAILAVLAISFAWADRAPANGPPPPRIIIDEGPPDDGTLPMIVKVDPTAKVSRLILPPEAAGGEEVEAAPRASGRPKVEEAPPAESKKGAFLESPARSILAGLCLSLAIGAIFFVPRTSGAAQMILLGAVGLGVVGAAAVALADKSVPPPPRQTTVQLTGGPVKVEWTGRRGAPVTLILAGPATRNPAAIPEDRIRTKGEAKKIEEEK